MARGPRIEVQIVGDSSQLERSFKRSERAAGKFGRDMSRTTRGAIVGTGVFKGFGRSVAFASGAFLGGFGLTAAVRAAADEMLNAQKVTAQTVKVLETTRGAAGVTAKQVDTLAQSLMNLSGVDDEAIKTTENLLLTFTQVRNEAGKGNDVFNQATKAALNLSVRFGKDLSQSAIQVGKALQDPIRGVTALRRVGVSFTDAQRKQIKALVESGHILEAQKIILRELQVETGGAAKAAGATLAGRLNILKQNALNLAGAIATILTPSIRRTVDQATRWLQNNENQRRVLNNVRSAAQAVAGVLNTLKSILQTVNSVAGGTKNTIRLLFGAFVAFKTLRLVATLTEIAGGIGGIGTQAATATGKVRGLNGAIGAFRGLGPTIGITLLVELLVNKQPIDDWLRAHHAGFLTKGLLQDVTDLERKLGLRGGGGPAARPPHDLPLGGGIRGAIPPTPRRPPRPDTRAETTRKVVRGLTKGQQNTIARLRLAVQRAELTKTTKDDLAALHRLEGYIKQQIKVHGHILELEQDLVDVQSQINAVLDEQTKKRKKRRKESDAPPLFQQYFRRLTGGLGLDVRQLRALTRRLRGSVAAPTPQYATAAAGVTINGPVHVHGVQNLRQFEAEMAKRHKSRPHQRHGAH